MVVIMAYSCSSDEENSNNKKFTILSSTKVRIGDTIVVSGKNMSTIKSVKFKNRFQNVNVEFFEKSDDIIKVVVPALKDENFNIVLLPNSSGHNALDFDLIGSFELPQTTNAQWYNLGIPQMVNENAFLVKGGSSIFKSIDGGYSWTILKQMNGTISGMYFLNENTGWVSVRDSVTSIDGLYFTNDGGSTFNKIYTLTSPNIGITDIHFSNENNGYLLTSNGKIYTTTDNSNFALAYNFPGSEEGEYLGFNGLSVYNDNLVVSHSKNVEWGFIRKINANYDYISYPRDIGKSQLVGDLQAYFVVNDVILGQRLYYTNSFDSNWEVTSTKQIHNFYFYTKDKGIGISREGNIDYSFETSDGGKNWTNKCRLGDIYPIKHIFSSDKAALITTSDNKMWKHIYE